MVQGLLRVKRMNLCKRIKFTRKERLTGVNLLKSGAIKMGYTAISTNERSSINAHKYNAR